MGDAQIALQKEEIRRALSAEEPVARGCLTDPHQGWGKVAERVRRLPFYRKARCICVPPIPFLRQIGINALGDRKMVVVPSPQLREGFFLFDPASIPPPKRTRAISPSKRNPYARRLDYRKHKIRIDMMIAWSLAVAQDGSRLGDGSGHFDIQVACLNALGWIHDDTQVVAVSPPERIKLPFPMKTTDIGVHWIVTRDEIIQTPWDRSIHVSIIWRRIDFKTIRRNDALFFLRSKNPPLRKPGASTHDSSRKGANERPKRRRLVRKSPR